MSEDRERADRKRAKAIAVAIDRRNETALDNDEWWDYIEEKIYKALTAVRAERDEEWAKAAEEILSIGHTPQHFGGEEFQAKFQSACARLRAFAEGVKG